MNQDDLISQLKSKFSNRIQDVFIKSKKRVYITIGAKDIKEISQYVFRDLACRFNIASAVDNLSNFEILYHFTKDDIGSVLSLRVTLHDKNDPHIDSITPFLKGAEWIEREMHELFGIEFDGHPNMKPLLLPDDWPQGVYPLRKDFIPPKREDRGHSHDHVHTGEVSQ